MNLLERELEIYILDMQEFNFKKTAKQKWCLSPSLNNTDLVETTY